MIDCEIVIGDKDDIQSAAGGDTEHPEGLLVKFLFNAVTVNQDLISHFAADKKVNYFIFCFELFILLFGTFLPLTMYVDHAVHNQTFMGGCSHKLSIFLTSNFRQNAIGCQVRD